MPSRSDELSDWGRTNRRSGWRPGGDGAHPPNLKPSCVPLVLVAGAPCSGKSLFCQENKADGDLVIDLDAIAGRLADTTPHGWDKRQWLQSALEERNRALFQLGDATCLVSRAWFIVSAPTAAERSWWQEKLRPERIIVLEADRDTCLRRLFADPERKLWRPQTVVAIEEWFRRFSARPGDASSFLDGPAV